jgi:ribonuclease P protein component
LPGEAPQYGRLRRRSEFLAAAKGLRSSARAFSLQAIPHPDDDQARFGFTTTKKIGNAVERARMRRRLKEAMRTTPGLPVRHGYDYVFVARREALSIPFAELTEQITRALADIGTKLDRKGAGLGKSGPDDVSMKTAARL